MSLRLDKAFAEGELATKTILNGQVISPPKNHKWLILSGEIAHVTGTDTDIRAYPIATPIIGFFQTSIPAANATSSYSLFNNVTDYGSGACLIILTDKDAITIDTHAAGGLCFRVLEWK